MKTLDLYSKIKIGIPEDLIKTLYSVLLWALRAKAIVVFLLLGKKKKGWMLFVCSITALCFWPSKKFIVLLGLRLCISHKWRAVLVNECLFKHRFYYPKTGIQGFQNSYRETKHDALILEILAIVSYPSSIALLPSCSITMTIDMYLYKNVWFGYNYIFF